MKKILITLTLAFSVANSFSQTTWTDKPVQFNPYIGRTDEQLRLQAQANVRNDAIKRQNFINYMNAAMQELNKGNYSGFITNSNYALATGYSNPQVYYYRGIAFENLGEKSNAKKSYKKAYKQGSFKKFEKKKIVYHRLKHSRLFVYEKIYPYSFSACICDEYLFARLTILYR
jgi:tetratricopeptide (TPR) repeat protein